MVRLGQSPVAQASARHRSRAASDVAQRVGNSALMREDARDAAQKRPRQGVTRSAASAFWTLGVGSAAGFTSCVILQPFDLLKTRMQQEPLHALAHNPTETRTQRLVRTFQGITQKDGWKGLWRGTTPTIVRNVPGVAAYFYTIHELRWLVAVWQIPWLSVEGAMHAEHAEAGSTLAKLSTPGNLATGAFARVSIGFVLNPITVVKSRFESSNFARDAYPTVRSSLRSIYRDAGFRGFFRGYSATALRDAPYAGLYLAFYEHGKHLLSRLVLDGTAQVNSGKWWVVGTSSILAGTLATIVTQPFDIIKTRMQTTPTNILEQEALKRRKSATALAVARHVLKTNGIGAFADGLGLRCARKAASSMIGWSIFELGNRWAVQGATRK